MPPPAEAPQEAPDSDDPLLMQEAVVTSDAAGKLHFGKEGKLTFLSVIKGFYTMVTTSGVFQIKPEWLQLKSSKPFVARVQWPKWSQLSKNDLKLWLSQLSCNPDDQLGMGPEEWSTHTSCCHALPTYLRWRISTCGLAGVFSAGASRRLMCLSLRKLGCIVLIPSWASCSLRMMTILSS